MNLPKLLKISERLVVDNSPGILTGIGVAGTIVTAYLTGRATARAVDIIREFESDFPEDPRDELRERILLTWKLYIPPAAAGTISIVSIVGANRIGTRRAAALAAAYSLSEHAFAEYRERVVETMGKKKEQQVQDDVAQEQVRKNPPSEIIITDDSQTLCYEAYTGRYFYSTMDKLRKAELAINYRLLHEGYVSLTDFFDLIGLARTDLSEEVGWKNNQMLELQYSAVLTENERPCISIRYRVEPVRRYYRND